MNPLFNSTEPATNGNIESIKRMMNMFNSAGNPQGLINMLAQKNPNISNILQMANGDLKGFFYAQCKQKGVNPDDILNQLKS